MAIWTHVLFLAPLLFSGIVAYSHDRLIKKITIGLNSAMVIIALGIALAMHPHETFCQNIPLIQIQKQPLLIWSLYVDRITNTFLIYITLLYMVIQHYALAYIQPSKQKKYMVLSYLFLFTCIGIIISGHLFFSFFFWEWMGTLAYLLILTNATDKNTYIQGKKIWLTQKLGDISLLMGIGILWIILQEIHWYQMQHIKNHPLVSWGISSILIGLYTKSAQGPFAFWLPKAMIAPTPVSALLHSATMVIMGMYLTLRLAYLFTPWITDILFLGGIFTAFWGALRAYQAWNIKKIWAYATVSQIGYVSIAIGLGDYTTGWLQMIMHGCIKSSLFLCAGIFIQNNQNPSWIAGDIRWLRKIKTYRGVVFLCALGAFCLMALPYFPGWYPKEKLWHGVVDWTYQKINQGYIISILPLGLWGGTTFLTILYLGKVMIHLWPNKTTVYQKKIWPPKYKLCLLMSTGIIISLFFSSSLDIQDHWLWRVLQQNTMTERSHYHHHIPIYLINISILGLYAIALAIVWKLYHPKKKYIISLKKNRQKKKESYFKQSIIWPMLCFIEKLEWMIQKIYPNVLKKITFLSTACMCLEKNNHHQYKQWITFPFFQIKQYTIKKNIKLKTQWLVSAFLFLILLIYIMHQT